MKNNLMLNPPAVVTPYSVGFHFSVKKRYIAAQSVQSDRVILISFFKEGIKVIDEARTQIRKQNPNLFL